MRISIKLKLALAFGLVIALMAGATALAVNGLTQLNATIDGILHGPATRQRMVQELSETYLLLQRADKNMVLAQTDADAAPFSAQIDERRAAARQLRDRIAAIATEEGKRRLAAMTDAAEK